MADRSAVALLHSTCHLVSKILSTKGHKGGSPHVTIGRRKAAGEIGLHIADGLGAAERHARIVDKQRRRLLARDLESLAQRYYRHADIQRGWAAQAHLDDRERLGRMVTSSESRAAKYARWAERLRNA